MGCDIHYVIEHWYDNHYIGVDVQKHAPFRNYDLFGSMCKGIRIDIPGAIEARGIPSDASGSYKDMIESENGDYHSPSYLNAKELEDALERVKGCINDEILECFELCLNEPGYLNPRICFYFDN